MRKQAFVVPSLFVLAAAASASAAPLNLVLDRPDITSGVLNVSYNATTDTLTVTGAALTIDFDGAPPPDHGITGGTFTLTAVISSTGVLSSGSLTITGTVGAIGATSPLLTANLTSFGFSSSPLTQIFEFTGPVTGGSQAGAFGSLAGTILSLGGGFGGSFNTNFSNSGFGTADTARIPAPGAVSLLAAATVLGLTRRRR